MTRGHIQHYQLPLGFCRGAETPEGLIVILVKRSQSLDLIVKVFGEWFRKGLNNTPQLLFVVVPERTSLAVFVEPFGHRRKSWVLFDVIFHDSFDLGDFLDIWREYCLFDIMVMMHAFTPALTLDQQVASHDLISFWEI